MCCKVNAVLALKPSLTCHIKFFIEDSVVLTYIQTDTQTDKVNNKTAIPDRDKHINRYIDMDIHTDK